MSLKEKISADLKEAMKARDQVLVDTLRSAISALIYKHTETGRDLKEDEEIAVMQKQVKQRQDSIAGFEKGGRHELVKKETRELEILSKYLPAQKSEAEIKKIISGIINDLPKENRNQGAIMKAAMAQLKGAADGNLVRQLVEAQLQDSKAG